MRRGILPLAQAVLVLLLVAGCAHRVDGPASMPPQSIKPPAVSAADLAFAEGETEMQRGNYERALEMFAAVWKESPGHPGVSKDFPEALSALKTRGDDAFRHGKLEEAGRHWAGVLRFASHPAEKGRHLPFTKSEIRASIDRVSSSLMEKGLIEYRKGNLDAAIALWKSILAYDPSHVEAAGSVRTATTQLENLKKIGPAK
ncbi:MAG: hypothetical protein HY896_04250 [Deltaproteobacteria bacterium]|nr:hypothetical protein [Deltaproteobacteria bacterium]